MALQVPAKVTVLYDGACPLCRREIDHYRRIDEAGRIVWTDIASHPEAADALGLDWSTAMQQLHVLDADGRWHIGLDAFTALWSELPYYRRLAPVARLPLVRPLLQWGYRRFARWRYRRRCGSAKGADGAGESCRVRLEPPSDIGIGADSGVSPESGASHALTAPRQGVPPNPRPPRIPRDEVKVQT